MTINVNIDKDVFNKTYRPFINCDVRTQIFFGGSSSGKSFFLAQRCVIDLLKGGRNYLITRNVSNTLRGSTFNEIKKAITAMGCGKLFKIRESDMLITCINGYQIMFRGLDDPEKIKSVTPAKGVITDIWVEEATETKYEAVKQLRKRLRGQSKKKKRIVLSFNPILRSHWIYTEYFDGWIDSKTLKRDDELLILKTTYKDNGFLESDDIWELENEKDEYYREVYTYGNWGTLGDVIFKNWKTMDLSGIRDSFSNIKNGLDFGYANDPTAYIRSHYDRMRKKIYIFGGFAETGLTNPAIANLLFPILGDEQIVCDSSEPKSIQELRDNRINAVPARKGKDSVLFGIQWMQQNEIIIDEGLQGVINEFQLYQWKKDTHGETLNVPIDKNNHYIDGLRYSYEDEQLGYFQGCNLQ